MQEITLGLIEFLEVCMSPLLKSVKVPWGGIPSLQQTSYNTQLGVICRLAEDVLNPSVQVTGEDINHYLSQYGSLKDTSPYWFPLRYWTIAYRSSEAASQRIPYVLKSQPFKSVSFQFRYKMWHHVKGLAEICVDDICSSSLVHWCSSSIVKD